MNKILFVLLLVLSTIMVYLFTPCQQVLMAGETEFNETKACFENFVRCELTRTDAVNHFHGKTFTISMVDFFDIQKEGDLIIITGAVKCWVEDKYDNLYIAVGVKEIFEKKKVSYYLVRKEDFTILATELMNYPYKERCKWLQYWIDID